MASVKYDFCANFCVFFFLFVIFGYLVILLSIFAAEIQFYIDFEDAQSHYSSNEKDAFVLGIQNSYDLTTLNPIISLQIISSNNSCPNNTENLGLYLWNTQTICVCPYTAQFSSGSCPDYAKTNCYTTGERELLLYSWKGVYFCATRTSNWYKKNSDSNCSSSYISCANNICVKNDSNIENSNNLCPITKISITKNETNQTSNNSTYNDQWISDLNDNSSLFISKDYEGDFLISLQVEINGPPCVYPLEAPTRNEFQLLKSKPNGCLTYGQDTKIYKEIDSEIEWNLYLQNNLEKLTEDIKNIQSFAQNSANLYAVTRTQTSCSPKFVLEIDDPIKESLFNLRKGGNTIGLIFIIICLLLFIYNFYHMLNKREYVDSVILASLLIIIIFVQGIVCPISLYYVSESINNNYYLSEIYKNKCFSYDGYNKMISNIAENQLVDSTQAFGFINSILYISLVLFLLIIFYLMDKIKFNLFFDEEAQGALEESEIMGNCKINLDEIDCDCLI